LLFLPLWYTYMLGLRNSHDKSLPIGIAFGSRVIVCDNLALSADHVIRRKHTIEVMRELPALLADIVRPLQDQRANQNQPLIAYKETPLTDAAADHCIPRPLIERMSSVQALGMSSRHLKNRLTIG
jgi:hypothetical protein